MFPISIMVAPQCLKKQWDPSRKQDHSMNIAPDINNHLRSIDIFRSKTIVVEQKVKGS